MDFVQKVYWSDKPVILTCSREAYLREHPQASGYFFASGATEAHFTAALEQLEQGRVPGALIEDPSPERLQSELCRLYQPVPAGGGVVTGEDGRLLLIYRRGKWDLPKGKLDPGEDLETCALREVREETGLTHLRSGPQIGETWHIYAEGSRKLLKHTTWFRMYASEAETPVPQQEEGILEVRWVAGSGLGRLMNHSYEAIRDILRKSGFSW